MTSGRSSKARSSKRLRATSTAAPCWSIYCCSTSTPFFNVGEHNIIRLEGADWNDGLDMARTRGESVAFTALYASNLKQLSELVLALEKLSVSEVEIAAELIPLLDTLQQALDYTSIAAKHERLKGYFESVRHTVSGDRVRVSGIDLANDLRRKAEWLMQHLRAQEWITNHDGFELVQRLLQQRRPARRGRSS